jgi:uncharacterized radical SAM superfamily Fe-S cluster-containing enzyme
MGQLQILGRGSKSKTPTWATPSNDFHISPEFGVPRTTQSLCPDCNRIAVDTVLTGASSLKEFAVQPGVIAAEIVEERGRVLMRKTCSKHGAFEDVLSTDPGFFRRMESLYFRRDFPAYDTAAAEHGPCGITTGRGIALVVDLTNRCNLKCSPCFMDANNAPYVHELSMQDIRVIFDRARAFKPQRDINILFSGGEPTIAPNLLNAVRYAKSVGFNRLCVVTNGIRFAQEKDFAFRTREAGVHQVYLQLDGVSNVSHVHRGASNLFDVKTHALENIARAGMKANLQVTVVNGLNNHAVGDIVRFAIENIDKTRSVLFQPIMFAGRDAHVTDDVRRARRYTFADLAHDLKAQFSTFDWEPMRDWFPMSVYSVFGRLFDTLNPKAAVGSMFADVHPNQGIVSPLLVDQVSKQVVPLSSFVNVERLLRDVVRIADRGRGASSTKAQIGVAMLRNFDRRKAPLGFTASDLSRLFAQFEPRFRSDGTEWAARDNDDPRWRLLMVAGMWFQDLFNFDLNMIRMDAARVAVAQQGEISFCAYNSAGWRQVVEHVQKTADLAEWHRRHGRHPIYANGIPVTLTPVRGAEEEVPDKELVASAATDSPALSELLA